jgi:hypothetical protein
MKESELIGDHKSLFKLMDFLPFGKLTANAKLLYRASRDGKDPETFHELCDGKDSTLVLIKAKFHGLVGGYAPDKNVWDAKSKGNTKSKMLNAKEDRPFIFTLKEGIAHYGFRENCYRNEGKKQGPMFATELQIVDDSKVEFNLKGNNYAYP